MQLAQYANCILVKGRNDLSVMQKQGGVLLNVRQADIIMSKRSAKLRIK